MAKTEEENLKACDDCVHLRIPASLTLDEEEAAIRECIRVIEANDDEAEEEALRRKAPRAVYTANMPWPAAAAKTMIQAWFERQALLQIRQGTMRAQKLPRGVPSHKRLVAVLEELTQMLKHLKQAGAPEPGKAFFLTIRLFWLLWGRPSWVSAFPNLSTITFWHSNKTVEEVFHGGQGSVHLLRSWLHKLGSPLTHPHPAFRSLWIQHIEAKREKRRKDREARQALEERAAAAAKSKPLQPIPVKPAAAKSKPLKPNKPMPVIVAPAPQPVPTKPMPVNVAAKPEPLKPAKPPKPEPVSSKPTPSVANFKPLQPAVTTTTAPAVVPIPHRPLVWRAPVPLCNCGCGSVYCTHRGI